MQYARLVLLIFCLPVLTGCFAKPKPPEPAWVEVDCSECDGYGVVTYNDDHWFVVNGLEEPGTYQCSMCRGSGKLYRHRNDK